MESGAENNMGGGDGCCWRRRERSCLSSMVFLEDTIPGPFAGDTFNWHLNAEIWARLTTKMSSVYGDVG
jgi:hypothetical protein